VIATGAPVPSAVCRATLPDGIDASNPNVHVYLLSNMRLPS